MAISAPPAIFLLPGITELLPADARLIHQATLRHVKYSHTLVEFGARSGRIVLAAACTGRCSGSRGFGRDARGDSHGRGLSAEFEPAAPDTDLRQMLTKQHVRHRESKIPPHDDALQYPDI